MSASPRIFISAGEVSGDRYGAALVKAIRVRFPDAKFFGVGGKSLAQEGVELLYDLTLIATIGFLEPLRYIGVFFGIYRKIKRFFKSQPIDLVITIDFQGFNMVLLQLIQKHTIPSLYFIPPQEWQWGTVEGGKKVAALASKICSILKAEHDFYLSCGGDSAFVGHPIQDLVKPHLSRAEFYARHAIPIEKRLIAIYPGSRKQEVGLVGPVFFAAAEQMMQHHEDLHFLVVLPNHHFLDAIQKQLSHFSFPYTLVIDDSVHAIYFSEFGLCKSGSTTLEHGILKKPCIVGYRFSKLSYFLVKPFLKKKFDERVKYMALPNIFLNELVLPEFFQKDFTPQNISKKALEWIEKPESFQVIQNRLSCLQDEIGPSGAIEKTADEVEKLIART